MILDSAFLKPENFFANPGNDYLAAFGHITCVDMEGRPRGDLDTYFDDLTNF
jgi:hypothetical protein